MNNLRKNLFHWLLDTYKRRKLRLASTGLEHSLQVIRMMFKRGEFGFLVTQGENGWPSTRLVQPIIDFKSGDAERFEIWIGTNPNLRKVQEVKQNGRVTFAIEDRKQQANLVIYGEATLEARPEFKRRYWKGEWRLFFPDGPNRDDYVLIRIIPCRMELMNFGKHVVQEPFGLKPVRLEWQETGWVIA